MLIHRLPASRLGSRPISGVHAFTDLPALASVRLSVLPRVANTNLAEPHTGCVTGFEFHLTSKHSRRSSSWQCRRMKNAAKFPYTRNRAQPERFLSPLSRQVREGGPATRREMVSRTLFFPFKFYYTRSYPSCLNNSHPNLEGGGATGAGGTRPSVVFCVGSSKFHAPARCGWGTGCDTFVPIT